MALQVWLPLTKDLRNQGLSNVTVTNNGATFNSAGKLGGCYYFNGDKQWLQFSSVLGEYYNNDWSIACWLKPTDSTRSVIISEYNTSGASNVGLELTTSRVVRLYWNGSPDINFTTAGALPLNEWTHLTVTKTGRVVKVYFNGELKQTYTNSSDFSIRTSAAQPRIGDDYRGNSANTVSYQGYMNDFRMYDHCLSQIEVKELSKGLVLHYPLNRGGWGQENLVWNSNWHLHSTTPPENWTNWGSPPTREIVTIDGKNWLHVISNTTTFQGYSQNWTKRNGVGELTAGQKVTVSFTAYLAAAATIAPIGIHWNNSSGTIVSQNWTTTALTTSPKRYSFTYTTPSDCVAFNIMVGDNTNTAHEIWITDIKLELGEIATSWCPNSSDALATTMGLNGTTEYDCSGYCNNGTRTGTFDWTSDTPKYSVSQVFASGNNYIDCGASQSILPTDGLTVSLWVNYSTWGNPISCTEGGGWNFENSSGIQFPVYVASVGYKVANSGVATSTLQNGWHMLTGTFDKTNVKIYIDGVLKTTTATGSTNGVGYAANHCYIGAEAAGTTSIASAAFVGKISDVRIYATALSADDIKSLYQNCATIDADGTIHGQIRS